VVEGTANRRDLAFLRDRMLVNEGRKQIDGTQLAEAEVGASPPPGSPGDLVRRGEAYRFRALSRGGRGSRDRRLRALESDSC
jgi:hypothetical protein